MIFLKANSNKNPYFSAANNVNPSDYLPEESDDARKKRQDEFFDNLREEYQKEVLEVKKNTSKEEVRLQKKKDAWENTSESKSKKYTLEGVTVFEVAEKLIEDYIDSFSSEDDKNTKHLEENHLYQNLRQNLRILACDFIQKMNSFTGPTRKEDVAHFYENIVHFVIIPTVAKALNISEKDAEEKVEREMMAQGKKLPEFSTIMDVDVRRKNFDKTFDDLPQTPIDPLFNRHFDVSTKYQNDVLSKRPIAGKASETLQKLDNAIEDIEPARQKAIHLVAEKKSQASVANREAIFQSITKVAFNSYTVDFAPESDTKSPTTEVEWRDFLQNPEAVEKYANGRMANIVNSLRKSLESDVSKSPYPAIREQFQVLDDLENHIISRFETIDVKGRQKRLLIRDARFQPENYQVSNERRNWTVMGLKHFEAAEQMYANFINQENIDFLSGEPFIVALREKAAQYVELMQSSADPQYLTEKTSEMIAKMLSQEESVILSKNKAHKKMGKLKDFTNMDAESYSLATMHRHKKDNGEIVEMLEIDTPLYELTEEQKQEYVSVLQYAGQQIPDVVKHLEREGVSKGNPASLPKWYINAKDDETRTMIVRYASTLLSPEGSVIPTQMLNVMPGLRNAREARVYAQKKDENGNNSGVAKKIYQSHYAGNIAHDTKNEEENIRMTMMSIRQFQAMLGLDLVLINSWIAPIAGNEKRLHKCAEEAVRRINAENKANGIEWEVVYDNTPINSLRVLNVYNGRKVEDRALAESKKMLAKYLGKNDLSEAEAIQYIDGIVQKMLADPEGPQPIGLPIGNVGNKYIVPEIQKNTQTTPLINYDGLEIMAKLLQSLAAHEHIKSRTIEDGSLRFGNQDNAQRSAHTNQMVYLMNESADLRDRLEEESLNKKEASEQEWWPGKPDKKIGILTGCKSGKDRMGFVAILSAIVSVVRYLTGYSPELSAMDKNYSAQKNPKFNADTEKVMTTLKKAAGNIADAGQVTTAAGLKGGSEGSEGLKDAWYAQIVPKWMKEYNLAQTTANKNKGFYKKSALESLKGGNPIPGIIALITAPIQFVKFITGNSKKVSISEDEKAFLAVQQSTNDEFIGRNADVGLSSDASVSDILNAVASYSTSVQFSDTTPVSPDTEKNNNDTIVLRESVATLLPEAENPIPVIPDNNVKSESLHEAANPVHHKSKKMGTMASMMQALGGKVGDSKAHLRGVSIEAKKDGDNVSVISEEADRNAKPKDSKGSATKHFRKGHHHLGLSNVRTDDHNKIVESYQEKTPTLRQ